MEMPVLLSKFPELHFALSDREDGNLDFRYGTKEEVMENRRRFFSKHDIPHDRCAGLSVVHGKHILHIGEKDLSDCAVISPEADAMITDDSNTYLFLKVADCYPAVVYDPRARVLALVHCGYESIGLGIVADTFTILKETYSSQPADVVVYIGPGIRKESHHLRKDLFLDYFSQEQWLPYIKDLGNGRIEADVLSPVVHKFLIEGVQPANIEVSQVDTGADQKYFSRYRAVRFGEKEGRIGLVVGMRQ